MARRTSARRGGHARKGPINQTLLEVPTSAVGMQHMNYDIRVHSGWRQVGGAKVGSVRLGLLAHGFQFLHVCRS